MKNSFFLISALLFFNNSKAQFNPPIVKIGSQTWMIKNLDIDHYRNGDLIPEVKDSDTWFKLTTGAWCYQYNDSTYGKIYGKLYNWYAVNDPRGLAPKGWRVPSDGDWSLLTIYLGGKSLAGGKMKETGISHWEDPNADATNTSGFNGLPGGGRGNSLHFDGVGNVGYWWSSTEDDATFAWYHILVNHGGFIGRYKVNKPIGFSVRCIKD